MQPARSLQKTVAIALTLGLAISAMAAGVAAAPPEPDGHAIAVPGEVAPNNDVRFNVDFTATPPANYSQLMMTAVTPVGGDFKRVIEQPTVNGMARGLCAEDPSGNLACDFGPLNTDETVRLAVLYNVGTAASPFNVEFLFTAPGAAPADKGGKSRKTSFPILGSAAINSSGNLAGGYFEEFPTGGVETVGQVNRGGNPQNTRVPSVPGFGNGAIVVKELRDNASDAPPDSCASYTGATCVGQWSFVNVEDGATFPGGFQIILTIYGTYPNLNLVHITDDLRVDRITETCTFTPGFAAPDQIRDDGQSCKTISWDKVTTATMWVTENGWGRGY